MKLIRNTNRHVLFENVSCLLLGTFLQDDRYKKRLLPERQTQNTYTQIYTYTFPCSAAVKILVFRVPKGKQPPNAGGK